MTTTFDDSLKAIPQTLRRELEKHYKESLAAYQAGDWEKVGLKAGKVCEVIYSIIKGHADGAFPSKPSKPPNMVKGCTDMENLDSSLFPRSVRIQIPRVLIAVYELRNNRDIGHVGGDIDPNQMDADFFLRSIKWLVAELVRIFHQSSVDEACKIVELISERSIPMLWEREGVVRALDVKLSTPEKVLAVLYHIGGEVSVSDLCSHVKYSNLARFKSTILKKLDKDLMVEWSRKKETVIILPPGLKFVEEKIFRK